MLAEQVIVGGVVLGFTMTLKVQLVVLPEPSVAVQVTVLVPFGKIDPLGGLQLVVTPEQLSLAVGAKVTARPVQLAGSELVMILAGGVIVGRIKSFTVTVKVQMAEPPVVVAGG